MEAASKKRGRPPDPLMEAMRPHVKSWNPHIKTRRGLDEHIYAMHAISVLLDLPEPCGWIYDEEKGRTNSYRPPYSLLAELGRIPWDNVLRELAIRLAKEEPRFTVKLAVAAVRIYRLMLEGKDSTPPPEGAFTVEERVRLGVFLEELLENPPA